MVFLNIKLDFMRGYVEEMPEKYKGSRDPHIEVQRDPKTGAARHKLPSEFYSLAELRSLNSETIKCHLQNDDQWVKVKKTLDRLHVATRHVSKRSHVSFSFTNYRSYILAKYIFNILSHVLMMYIYFCILLVDISKWR